MSKKDLNVLQKEFLQELEKNLKSLGYKYKKNTQSFEKELKDGKTIFHISFIEHEDDFDITADVAIRFDELESLINSNNSLMSEPQKKNTFSIGSEIGNIIDGQQKRWSIYKKEDIVPVAKSIFFDFQKIGIPYIEKYSDMEETYKVLSRDDKEIWIHSPLDGVRAIRAVGLAKLLNKIDIDSLIERKEKYLREKNDFGLENFLRFVSEINNR